MEKSISESLEYALEPKIISCMAGAWPTGDSYCLPLDTAAAIMRETRCRVVVATIQNVQKSLAAVSGPRQRRWGIAELTDKLALSIEDLVFFLNTALCSNQRDVDAMVDIFSQLGNLSPFCNYRARFLKLEILDDRNHPQDEETCKALRDFPIEVRSSCLPFLSGDLRWLEAAIDLGCPGIRIWCSEIGQGRGISDLAKLEKAVAGSSVPLILEGGLGTAEDVLQALDLGFDAVLLNSAFRYASDPVLLAGQIRESVDSFYNERHGSKI